MDWYHPRHIDEPEDPKSIGEYAKEQLDELYAEIVRLRAERDGLRNLLTECLHGPLQTGVMRNGLTAEISAALAKAEGEGGQDRESYTDTQDRESYKGETNGETAGQETP
jgi:hypothetical protein